MACPILSALLVMRSISSVFLAVDEEKEKYYKLGKVESSAIYFKSPKLSFVGLKFKCNLLFGFEGAIYYSYLKLKIVQSDLPQHTPLLNEAWFSGEKVAIGPASLWSINEMKSKINLCPE